jgi:lipid-A-disaccharide synthase
MIFYQMSKRVMISAGEASGELYGALLIQKIKKKWPDAEIFGIGGKRMKSEGIHMIASISGSFGLSESFLHWGNIIRTFRKAKETLVRHKPDILVLIDYPEFNIALAKKAKSSGIPVLYYVSPQVWAWRSGRVKKIASRVDRMAVLFPFEVELYKRTGLPCEFVGHPVAETIDFDQSKVEIKKRLGIGPDTQVIALLPGSRVSEIKRHEALLRMTAEKIHSEFPDIQIVVPLAPGTDLKGECPDYMKKIHGHTVEAVACSDATAVASGTATLETALLGVPMVVFYRLSSLTVFLGRILIKVRFISLVNLLSNRGVVLELIQKNATAENVFSEIKKLLKDSEYRHNMILNLQDIRKTMGGKNASSRVASMVGELAGWNSTND